MVNAEEAPQQYSFSNHEFRRMFPANRKSLAFIVYIHRSKPLNNIKTSPLAHALVGILKESNTAVRLTENSTYEFMLDENFIFHVRRNEVVANNDLASASAVSVERAMS
jgi:hypothetical protein